MGHAQTLTTFAPARLTWPQICQQYPDQWVVLVDIDWLDDMYEEVRTALVAGHGGRDQCWDTARPLWSRFNEMAHLFTAPPRPRTSKWAR